MTFNTGIAFPVFLILGMTLFGSCSDYQLRISACDNCLETKPDSGYVELLFSIDSHQKEVPFQLFEGTYEEGTLLFTDTAISESVQVQLEVKKSYSLVAKYNRDNDTILVINAIKINARKAGCSDDGSDEITHYCWYTTPVEMDLTLKTNLWTHR